jgi:hypothetical protein
MVHNDLQPKIEVDSGNLRSARRRRAARLRAGEGAADGAALFSVLMIEIKSKLKIPRSAYALQVKGTLRLPFEQRQKSRLHAKLSSGEEVALMLPRGEILRGGDLVTASDGRIIEVIAEVEKLAHVDASSRRRSAARRITSATATCRSKSATATSGSQSTECSRKC